MPSDWPLHRSHKKAYRHARFGRVSRPRWHVPFSQSERQLPFASLQTRLSIYVRHRVDLVRRSEIRRRRPVDL